MKFYIVDVFAEEKYAGNQLAVVRGGAGLPDERLQKIALEMNYSETTFVLSEEETEGGYHIRIFTPSDEGVEQGYEIDRPSLLCLRASRDGGEIGVDVGGKVQMVARGELV